MKIAIIEDENLASSYLKSILERQTILSISEIYILKSVKNATIFFKENSVDLAFMDIHLGDGKSLDIFEQTTISCPVIFITAYDSYAVKVFKHFTIDYLLKPYAEEELLESLMKYKNIKDTFNPVLIVKSLTEIENKNNIQYNFLVNHRDKLISINDSTIAYFFATGKHLFIHTNTGHSYLYNNNLKDLVNTIDSVLFFKVSRKYIINRNHIQEIVKHNSQKIEILLNVTLPDSDPLILSKKEISNFKNWLNS
ncbi:LytR/AlgR family response regulator transcription factor [Flavobacterium sp. Arc2]|uniref:LytR/AlgR family response regulator transcription factor n=1 Tax=Flavobacterium sp. Arc2 TaxID=3046685 RepID=UPI00352C7AE4